MKIKSILLKTVPAFLFVFVLFSCNNDDKELDVVSDVYAINQKFGTEVKTALAYYSYANQSLESTVVTLPKSGGTVSLEVYPGSVNTMSKEPEDSDFNIENPVNGKYKFTVTASNGSEVVQTDSLKYIDLGIPEFTKTLFSGSPVSLETEWTKVTGAEGYVVKMFDMEGKLLFTGYTVNKDTNKYIINSSSGTGYWSGSVENSEECILQINAIVFDYDATNTDYLYNINEVSIGESQITWGVNQ